MIFGDIHFSTTKTLPGNFQLKQIRKLASPYCRCFAEVEKESPVVRSILLKSPKTDSAKGVSRKTLRILARKLRISEANVVHLALAKFASSVLRRYDADDQPLSKADLEYIRYLARSSTPTGKVLSKKTLL